MKHCFIVAFRRSGYQGKLASIRMRFYGIVLLLLTGTSGYDLKFDYQIREGNARFVEKVETKLEKNVVEYYVPQHNDVMESYKIQDFKQNKQITCLPSLKECRLRDIDTAEMGGNAGAVAESFLNGWNKGVNSISSDKAKVVQELYYVVGPELSDTVSLGEELRRFYEKFGYPLYQEKKVPKDAEIVQIAPGKTNRRTKRQITVLNPLNCQGETPKMVFGMDTGRSCNYIRLCQQLEGTHTLVPINDCPDFHITSPLVFTCSCCPWVNSPVIQNDGGDCACTRLYDPSNRGK